MRKCRVDEVLAPIIALVAQCTKGVQFNWAHYLYGEFLLNFRKVQELSKMFHYAWLLLSIVLIAWEFPKDIQFPSITAMYTSLWATKDAQRIKDNKIF